MTDRFFRYDPEIGFEFCQTAEHAKSTTEEDLEIYRELAADDDGWNDGVTALCWGEIRESVVLVSSKASPSGNFDTIDEYELRPVTHKEDEALELDYQNALKGHKRALKRQDELLTKMEKELARKLRELRERHRPIEKLLGIEVIEL